MRPPVRRRLLDVLFFVPHLGSARASSAEPHSSVFPGGAELQMLLLARGLADRGWRIGILTYDDGVNDSHSLHLQGIEIIRFRRPSQSKQGMIRAAEYLTVLGRVLPQLRARVIVQRAAGAETGLAAVLAKALRARFVYSSASVSDFDFSRRDPNPVILGTFRLGITLADSIVVQTREQIELCRLRFRRPALLIRSIAEPFAARSGSGSAFLWVGRIVALKHPEAYVALARQLPYARFRLVAHPPPPAGEVLAQRIELECASLPNVELLGPQTRGDLGELMEDAVAVVNTSKYEGMPNVFLEAWGRGVPALALSHDPDHLVQTEGLGGFAQGSSERLTSLAATLWRERHDQSELARRCREYVSREHSLDEILGRWECALGLTLDLEGFPRSTQQPLARLDLNERSVSSEPGSIDAVNGTPRCPLCGDKRHVGVERVKYDQVWRRFRQDFDIRFSAAVVAANTPAPEACLLECANCGLRFFAPVHPGNADFYRELMRGMPYVDHRWEFEVVAAKLKAEDSVLDLGCGDGVFLQRVKSQVGRVVGVDLNPDLEAMTAKVGIEAHNLPFDEFATGHARAFDVVCAFQVAEHMRDIAALMLPAATCLKRSGKLYVSVPNLRRRAREKLGPLDCPPHHVSRWTAKQVEALGPQFGLRLRRLYFEPPFYGPPSWSPSAQRPGPGRWRQRAATLLRDHVYASAAGRWLFESALYGRRGVVGHGILGEFELSPSSAKTL